MSESGSDPFVKLLSVNYDGIYHEAFLRLNHACVHLDYAEKLLPPGVNGWVTTTASNARKALRLLMEESQRLIGADVCASLTDEVALSILSKEASLQHEAAAQV